MDHGKKKGTKQIEIVATDDKRQITAVLACSLAGSFPPIQLIYRGTTPRCLPKSVFFLKIDILHIQLIIGRILLQWLNM